MLPYEPSNWTNLGLPKREISSKGNLPGCLGWNRCGLHKPPASKPYAMKRRAAVI